MRVVILGCGRVGSTLANMLDEEGHEVSIIDKNRDQFKRLRQGFKGKTVVGEGVDQDVLRRAGIEGADAFVAATEGDNRNIMTAQIAKIKFGVPKVIARIYDPLRADAYHELGIETICSTTLGAGLMRDYILGREWGAVKDYIKASQEK